MQGLTRPQSPQTGLESRFEAYGLGGAEIHCSLWLHSGDHDLAQVGGRGVALVLLVLSSILHPPGAVDRDAAPASCSQRR